MTEGVGQLTGVALEIDSIQRLVQDLERMLEMWEHDGMGMGGWGEMSHHWNRRRQGVMNRMVRCPERSLAHRQAHLAMAHLFPAWQRIHYRITRGGEADLSGLEEVKRRLGDATRAAARAPSEEAGDES